MVVCDNIAMEITVGVYLCRRFDADKCAEFGKQFSEGQSCPLYLPVVEKAINCLKNYGVPVEVRVLSAHRTPKEAAEFAAGARENGFGAIIAAAGKAAHLAGAMAAGTTLPVIGIPVKSSTLDGLDALLSTVQMPSGMPVATVAIDGAENAALLAIQILAVTDKELQDKLIAARAANREKILKKDAEISEKFN